MKTILKISVVAISLVLMLIIDVPLLPLHLVSDADAVMGVRRGVLLLRRQLLSRGVSGKQTGVRDDEAGMKKREGLVGCSVHRLPGGWQPIHLLFTKRKQKQRNEGKSIYCGFSELSETFDYCYECGVEGNPKNARLADVICNLAGFNVMARNLHS